MSRRYAISPARFTDAVNRRSSADLAELFVPDGVWVVPGMGAVQGTEAIGALLVRLLDDFSFLVQQVTSGSVRSGHDRAAARWYIEEWVREGRAGDGSSWRLPRPAHPHRERVTVRLYGASTSCIGDGPRSMARSTPSPSWGTSGAGVTRGEVARFDTSAGVMPAAPPVVGARSDHACVKAGEVHHENPGRFTGYTNRTDALPTPSNSARHSLGPCTRRVANDPVITV